jgi:hypothetical protein
MKHGEDGWVLAEMHRVWLFTVQGGMRYERITLTYENEITHRRETRTEDISRRPLNRRVLRQGYLTKGQFRALVNEHGECLARQVVDGGAP